MITEIDTNILLDLLTDDKKFATSSTQSLIKAEKSGPLIICEMVYAELAAAFDGDIEQLDRFLLDLSIKLLPSTRESLGLAGKMWRQYRREGGKRTRLLTDFFVGAHAIIHADRLLTRDRGFYRKYFKILAI